MPKAGHSRWCSCCSPDGIYLWIGGMFGMLLIPPALVATVSGITSLIIANTTKYSFDNVFIPVTVGVSALAIGGFKYYLRK